jgi:hypothetical protein
MESKSSTESGWRAGEFEVAPPECPLNYVMVGDLYIWNKTWHRTNRCGPKDERLKRFAREALVGRITEDPNA